jgi:peroxiredoxin Q/BCP
MPQRLVPGDPAPDFTLTTADGNELGPAQLRGHRVVLYFYPAAGTPGCTAQACDFRDSLASLTAAGYAVFGVSPDQPADLAQFRDEESLTFPLLADPAGTAHRRYGAWDEGADDAGTVRSTFVLDEEGRVVHALYDVPARGHVTALRQLLGLDLGPA